MLGMGTVGDGKGVGGGCSAGGLVLGRAAGEAGGRNGEAKWGVWRSEVAGQRGRESQKEERVSEGEWE
jgi:hypothetical protein